MDPQQFDSFVRKLGMAASRRRAVSAILAGLLSPLLTDSVEADRKKGGADRRGNDGDRDKQRGRDRDAGDAKGRGRARGKGRKKRGNDAANEENRVGGACREAGHPCEGNQRCCDGLVCIVSGPGRAERCTPCGNAGEPCCDDNVCGDGFVCDEDGTCVGCGGDGQPCCDGETCDDDAVCDASTGLCTACGGENQPCCADASCGDGFVCDDDNSCVACGDDGQVCCDGGDACGEGLTCTQGNQCVACGGADQPCCAGETCDGGFVCDEEAGECVVCGGAGQPCCETGDACGEGLSCTQDGVCSGCGSAGETCCADDTCDTGLVCDDDGICASCGVDAVVCGTGADAQCVPGVCCEEDEGEGPGCAADETCIAGGCISDDQFRIVLRWGADPRDLDSHLWLPPGGSEYHVFWPLTNRGSLTQFPFAELDIDDIDGVGPETITIADLQEGTYLYAVHHYAGIGTIGTSGATVQVFQGANLVRTYNAPVNAPWNEQGDIGDPYNDGVIWWQVFALTYDGTNAVITDIDTASNDDFVPYGTPGPVALLRSAGAGFPLKPVVAEGHGTRRRRRNAKNRRRARR